MLFRSSIPRVPALTSRARTLATPCMRLVHTKTLPHSSPLTHSRPSSPAHSHLHRALSESSSQAGAALRPRASFSTTAHRSVDKLAPEYIQAIQQELLRLMHERPEILSAVKEHMQAITDNGIDFPGRVIPSNMTFSRFTTQKDLSESGLKMCRAFLKVGIDISSEEMMVSLMEMQHIVKVL